ncbi:MAG: RDD family protein [Brevinematales bacterium]|nr:RDD family protein [Brevinematales bacterium]
MEIKEEVDIKQEEKNIVPLKFAPGWKRFLSFLIDSIVLGIIFFITINIVFSEELKIIFDSENPSKLYLDFLRRNYFNINFAFTIIYVSYFGVLWGGIAQTIGAKIMKIYVIDIKMRKLGFLTAFLRAFILYFSGNLFYLPLIFVINPVYKQRLHDFITLSVVVEKPESKKNNNKQF